MFLATSLCVDVVEALRLEGFYYLFSLPARFSGIGVVDVQKPPSAEIGMVGSIKNMCNMRVPCLRLMTPPMQAPGLSNEEPGPIPRPLEHTPFSGPKNHREP